MPRSAGVTTSAVIVFIGSAFSILCGAMMVLVSVFSMYSSREAESAGFNLHYILAIEAVIAFGFGGWGLATGIGLIKTKQWARISLLVYAAILVFFSLPAAVIMAFIPLPNGAAAGDANLPANFTTIIRVFITLVYGAFAALGGFWLYFFNTRSVKTQFLFQQSASEAAVGDLPLGTPIALPGESQPRRPLSITIIAWFLLITGALAPLFLVFNSSFYRGVKLPISFLGFFFYGRSATLIFVALSAAQLGAAVGLLKLKRWGLFAAIGLQCLTLLNFVLVVGIPSKRLKFQQIMDAMRSSMDSRMHHAYPFHFPAWIGMVGSLPIIFAILWFLVAERHAFNSSAQEPGNFGR
jgi:uncharacterized membrane protein